MKQEITPSKNDGLTRSIDFTRISNLFNTSDLLKLLNRVLCEMSADDFDALCNSFDIDFSWLYSTGEVADWLENRALAVVNVARAKEMAGDR